MAMKNTGGKVETAATRCEAHKAFQHECQACQMKRGYIKVDGRTLYLPLIRKKEPK